nr:unnamed protein product [Digitaria exilis]
MVTGGRRPPMTASFGKPHRVVVLLDVDPCSRPRLQRLGLHHLALWAPTHPRWWSRVGAGGRRMGVGVLPSSSLVRTTDANRRCRWEDRDHDGERQQNGRIVGPQVGLFQKRC